MGRPLTRLVESRLFKSAVMVAVITNALVLGLDTYAQLPPNVHAWCARADNVFIAIFIAELALKLVAWRLRFFANAWNLFDLAVVAVSVVAVGPFSVLRALRVLRTLRLVSVVPAMRRVVEALIRAVPGISAILGVLSVFFYVGAVLTTSLFGGQHPALFGTLGASFISLFQLMLFDGWANDIVRVVGETHPLAPFFFIVFTVVTGFAVLNLFIAVMVDALRTEHDRLQVREFEELEESQKVAAREIGEVDTSIRALEAKVDRLLERLEAGSAPMRERGREHQ
jgi:voltage-gated sodium channel